MALKRPLLDGKTHYQLLELVSYLRSVPVAFMRGAMQIINIATELLKRMSMF